MVKRSLAITSAAHLSIKNRQVVLSQDKKVLNSAPLEDLAIIVVDSSDSTWSSSLLAECGNHGIAVVFCGEKHLPTAILLPQVGHHLMAHIQRQQLQTKLPTKKRLWQTIITAKIIAQSKTLQRYGKDDSDLRVLLTKIKSGDTTNMEGVAAARYFSRLFGDDFIRDPELLGINSRLNYGYAILRAAVARSIVLSGLDVSLGIWHHNRFNAFALADDLIEPLRPAVDQLVVDSLTTLPVAEHSELNPAVKRHLLQILTAEVGWADHGQPLSNFPLDVALQRFCSQVREALTHGGTEVHCPQVL
jgi:CRISPR-associated protein Cas1